MARGDDDIGLARSAAMSSVKAARYSAVGPGHDDRRHARPVHRRHLGAGLVRRHLVGGMAGNHRDAGRASLRLVVGRPIDRAALQDADAQRRRARRSPARGRRRGRRRRRCARCRAVELRDRAPDRGGAVVDVVGDADRVRSRRSSTPRRRSRVGEEALMPTAGRRAAGRGSIRDWRTPRRPRAIPRRRAERHAGSATFIRLTSPVRIIVKAMSRDPRAASAPPAPTLPESRPETSPR